MSRWVLCALRQVGRPHYDPRGTGDGPPGKPLPGDQLPGEEGGVGEVHGLFGRHLMRLKISIKRHLRVNMLRGCTCGQMLGVGHFPSSTLVFSMTVELMCSLEH